MNSKEAIKAILKENKRSQTWLAGVLGYSGQSGVTATLSNKSSMTMKMFSKMADALGYEIVLQPKKRGRRPDGQIVIEESES